MKEHLIFKDDYVELYNCNCNMFNDDGRTVDLVFADPPFGMDLSQYEDVLMTKCSGHVFIMTNERVLIPFTNKFLDKFVRMYAINTVIPNMISAKAPMALADFVSEFRFGKTRFFNRKECFSTLIESKKIRMIKNYSQNFDKDMSLFAFFFNHFTEPGDTILDPFCGSGKSLIAARKLRRKAIGFEINKDSAEHAKRLLMQTVADLRIDP